MPSISSGRTEYDINIVKAQPLVPRELRFTVPERMDVHGAVRLPLDEGAVRTRDLGGTASTDEFADAVIVHL